MASTPTRLQKGTSLDDAYSLLNDNFEKVVQDIRDLGANISTEGLLTLTVGATSLASVVFTLTSQGQSSDSVHEVFTQGPVSAVTGIAPELDIFVDVDNDEGHRFPGGASLSSGQLNLYAICNVSNTGYINSLGAWLIQLNNRDSSSHTYYIHTQCGYLPVPAEGFFR